MITGARVPRIKLLALAIGTLTSSSACLWLRDLESLSDAPTNRSDGASASDGGVVTEGGSLGDGGCSGRAGPAMVLVPGSDYCIDSTEVTFKDYRAFLAAANASAPQHPGCTWNTSFAVMSDVVAEPDDHPIRGVDWCDAVAYCEWAGKRLCGRVGGGSAAFGELANAAVSQWYRACSMAGARIYPYGGSFEPERCNGGTGGGSADSVRNRARCEGGYAGVFDLSGNVREWEDSCEPGTAPDRACHNRGGAFFDVSGTLACANDQSTRADTRNPGLGLRCCSP